MFLRIFAVFIGFLLFLGAGTWGEDSSSAFLLEERNVTLSFVDAQNDGNTGGGSNTNSGSGNTGGGNGGTNSGSGGNSQPVQTGLQNIMDPLPDSMTEGTIATFIITLINWFLGILGIVFLIIVIYAGAKYMFSQSAQGTQEARSLITNAVIGLVIIFGSYLITQYIAGALVSSP